MVMLRKIKLPKIIITKKSWEKALSIFCKESGDLKQESLDITRLGYSGLCLSTRLRLLKKLMEAQFDRNDQVRMEVEEIDGEILRQDPTGRDVDGHIYWTQIDETADIRVYSEDYRYCTWGSIAQTRQELVSLVDRLKEEKLYKKEMERQKSIVEKKQAENNIGDAIEVMEKESAMEQDSTPEDEMVNFSCEVCAQNFECRSNLMAHHSSTHMAMHLRSKFSHLVDTLRCKVCKFEAKDENGIWVHIGADHDKVNSVLKENGLKTIEEVTVQEKPNENMPPPADNQGILQKLTDSEEEVIKKLEDKIDQLKSQMSEDSGNNEDTENSSDNQIPNNCNDRNLDSPRKRGRSKEKSNRNSKSKSKSKSESSSRSSSSKSQRKDSNEILENNKKKGDDATDGCEVEEEETRSRRPSRACKELTEAVKAAEFSFKKPNPSRSRSRKTLSSKPSSEDSSEQEESIENIENFVQETKDEAAIKKEEEEDSGFESKDIKDETDEEEQRSSQASSQASPSKRRRKCKNKSYNDDDPFGENEIHQEEEAVPPRKSSMEDTKVIDTSKAHVKERVETKVSCKRCSEWKDGTDIVFSCPSCGLGWHQQCTSPPLDQAPEKDWLCPLCQHTALIAGLEKALVSLDLKMEEAEEKRLAALTENQSLTKSIDEEEDEEEEEEEDDEDDKERSRSTTKSPKLTVQNSSSDKDVRKNYGECNSDEEEAEGPRSAYIVARPNYNEQSTDEEISGDEATKLVPVPGPLSGCTCENKGACLFCKKMKGCTCEGTGTCRLCMSELVIDEDRQSPQPRSRSPSSDVEIIEQPQMSTTELFLMTGQTRQKETPPPALEYVAGPGRARGRGRVRLRGGRVPARGVGRPGPDTDQGNMGGNMRPTNLRATLRPRGRLTSQRGSVQPRMVGVQGEESIQYTVVRPTMAPRPNAPRMARPDAFESGVMVRGTARPVRPPLRGAGQPMRPRGTNMRPPIRIRGAPMGGPRPTGGPPGIMGQNPRIIRPRMAVPQNQGYMNFAESNGSYGNPVQPKGPRYSQPRFGSPGVRAMQPVAQMQRVRGPGQPRMRGPMQPRLQMQGPRGPRPTRLAPPGQRGGLARPRMHLMQGTPVRPSQMMGGRPRGVRRPPRGRGVMRGGIQRQEQQVPEILSVHSNRLAGIMSNQYPDDPDDPDIVELDDDDDDEEDILVPTLNRRQPVPDYDIIANDSDSQSFEETGEYIEDDYEEAEQPKYFPQQEQYEVYDLE